MDAVCSRLRIGRRFRGPPGAANGGFASGSLAALLGGAVDVEVSLRRSVPLEHPPAATPRTRWDEQSPGTNVRTTAGGSG